MITTRPQNLVQSPKLLEQLNINLESLKSKLDEEQENINDHEEASVLKDLR